MFDNFVDLLIQVENARDAHQSVALCCASFNDLNGDYYHSGMAAAYSEVADYLRSSLLERDSRSGR